MGSPAIHLLGALFRAHRVRILLTYALVLLEETLALLYPFVIGLAINDLIKGGF